MVLNLQDNSLKTGAAGLQVFGKPDAVLKGARAVRLSLSLGVVLSLNLMRPALAQTINCPQALTFGRVAKCQGPGTIEVTPSGAVNTDGCLVPLGTPVPARCDFSVVQPQTMSIQVSVTANLYTMTGAGNMALSDFNVGTDAGGPVKLYAPSSFAGTQTTIGVGGKLTVPAAQTVGAYSAVMGVSLTFP